MQSSGKLYQWIINIIMIVFTFFCIMPFWLLFSASLTDDMELVRSGYAFFPDQISFSAYGYLWNSSSEIFRAYSITVLTTLVGTALGLTLTAMVAYPLSRLEMPFRNTLAFYVFFTMLFNGGLVPTYLLYTNYFDLKNTMLALIIPGLLMNGFLHHPDAHLFCKLHSDGYYRIGLYRRSEGMENFLPHRIAAVDAGARHGRIVLYDHVLERLVQRLDLYYR